MNGNDFLVNDDTTGGNANQVAPCVAIDGAGNIMIAWVGSRSLERDLYFQYFDRTGAAIGRNMRINENQGLDYRGGPSIAVNDAGHGAVVWYWEGNVMLQQIGPGGTLEGANRKVNDEQGTLSGEGLALSTNAQGEIAVVWMGTHDGSRTIHLQRYYANGLRMGGNVAIEAETWYPSVAMNDSGQVVVVWGDQSSGESRMWLQRFDETGAKIGANRIVSDQPGDFGQALISNEGTIAVIWQSPGDPDRVWFQRYAPSGDRLGGNALLGGITHARLVRWGESENTVLVATRNPYTGGIITLQCYDSVRAPVERKVTLQDHPHGNTIALDKRGGV
jgi:hypothetical protein